MRERLSATLGEAIDEFIADLAIQGRHGSAASYRHVLKPLLTLDTTVAHVTAADCRALVGERSLTVAASTLVTFHAVVSSFFSWAVEHDYAAVNPMAGVPKPKSRRPPHRWVSAVGLRRMYQACRTDNERLIMLLCGGSGLRAAELTGLRWRDVGGSRIRVLGKGQKWRELEPGPLAFEVMARLPHSGPYVTSYRTREALHDHVGRIARRAGVGHCTTHMLRHSFAIAWLERTDDAFTLQSLLGHANPTMTGYYLRDVRDAAAVRKQASVDLGGVLFGD